MYLKVIASFLQKKADQSLTQKLAVSILQEVLDICNGLSGVEENAGLLAKDAQFLLEKISKTVDEAAIQRMMRNFRDQVALRADFIKPEAKTDAAQRALYQLDYFLFKTQSKS